MRNQEIWERLNREDPDGVERGLSNLQQQHGISRDEAVRMVDEKMDQAETRTMSAGLIWILVGILILVLILAF